MPAYSDTFPWPSHYGHFNFFEDRMRNHNRVATLTSLGNGVYELLRDNGRKLKVFICECYSFGVAEYLESAGKIDDLNVVVISSNWCGYTDEAKLHCRKNEVGLFDIRDFMAALNKVDVWTYLNAAQKERFEKKGWL